MSFLNTTAKQNIKSLLQRMNEPAFTYLVGELYARQGARVDIDTGSHQVDFVLTDPNDNTDTIYGPVGVTCIQSTEQLSYQKINAILRPSLRDSFDAYYICTTSEHSLDSYTREKLQSNEYPDNWFTLKNYTDIKHLLEANYNDYLAYVYFELSPINYTNGWRDEQYLIDRLDMLGIATAEYAITKLTQSGTPLQDLNMIEKFVLSEAITNTRLAEHINPEFNKTHQIQVAVQNGRPTQSTINSSIFQ